MLFCFGVTKTHRCLFAACILVGPLSRHSHPCCYCDTVSSPPSAPNPAPTLETWWTTPHLDCSLHSLWTTSHLPHFYSAPQSVIFRPHLVFPPWCCLLQVQALHDLWGWRGLKGCSCPASREGSWDWSVARGKEFLVL